MEEASELLKISHRIENGGKRKVTVLGKTFVIGDTKRNILNKVNDIQYNVQFFEGEENFKTIKRRVRYVNNADARIASLLLLNGLANIPFLHSIHWRIINKLYTTETFSAIIETGLNDKETAFFLKNSMIRQNLLMPRMMMIKS